MTFFITVPSSMIFGLAVLAFRKGVETTDKTICGSVCLPTVTMRCAIATVWIQRDLMRKPIRSDQIVQADLASSLS